MKYLVSVVVTLACCQQFASAQQSKLDSFAFEGIALTSTIRDFRLRQPAAEHDLKQSEPASGLQCYAAKTTSSSGAVFHFFDDKLYRIEIIYDNKRIEKMGGIAKVAEKLKTNFGQPDDTQSNGTTAVLTWNTSNRNAQAVFSTTLGMALFVKDNNLEAALQDRRAQKTSLGF